MERPIAVLNAGSSSLKFSIFLHQEGQLQPVFRGQLEGLFTTPRFLVRDQAGETAGERSWPEGTRLGHEGAIEHLFQWAEEQKRRLGGQRLTAVGHRVGHGGLEYLEPVRIDAAVLADLERLIPLVPLHQPYNLAPINALRERRPELPQVACFDTAFHRTQPAVAQAFGYRVPIPRKASGATDSTGSRTSTSRPCCRSMILGLPVVGWWWPTWATAPASVPSGTAAAWPRPWASRHSTVCPWGPAAAHSIPA